MSVTFEFYGVLQRLAGASQRTITLRATRATVATALECLAQEIPNLAVELERTACAVGDQMVNRHDPIEPGMTIALLPPVAGG